ncbi:hypothetical protein SLEP1_g32698 [Rubroshorea leprosula]|uniref:BHLH domain-containing protein n=1 Tax=Rubroshorea leprosula TaxID=152421 RepID=A0AAV5KE66_9ROSI|nr:hypothetical protein SLEP1_g32698 [Rubroshorea leprosula]
MEGLWERLLGTWVHISEDSMREKGDMGSMEKWLRPFVERKGWDYCVVWKLGDDPSRFIEWSDCLCSGCGNVKKERDEKILGPLCRDAHFQHPVRTKACEALAQFPAFLSLYAGVHGDVVISKQPLWLAGADASDDSETSIESMGTRVLIPVLGGLIELFASKHIPEDQKMLELVTTQCNALVESEQSSIITSVCINEQSIDPSLEENLQKLPLSYRSSTVIPIVHPSPITQLRANPSFEGSSIGPNLPIEDLTLASASAYISPSKSKQLIKNHCTKRPSCSDNVYKQGGGSVLNCDNKPAKDNARVSRCRDKEHYYSKNLVTERNRRNRIKDGLFTLRALVPKISKMDRAAILGDAIDYIRELKEEEKRLRQELKELEEENREKSKLELKSTKLHGVNKVANPPAGHSQSSSGPGKTAMMEVHVEVNQLTRQEFLIRVFCEHKRGGFTRLMEALNHLSLQVIDANVTALDGKMMNTLRVEANKMDLQPKKLRDSLTKLINKRGESPVDRRNGTENEAKKVKS